ncbi:zinc finger MYM-type protein 1-like [Aphis craccivora]|uniref:Zinc finger MYM-type protein 1-like n=1 Tax=Aphis craccivora TaxID=307492 RepID=A0A6G0Y3Q3_APHCR|nr:zinc finger MYM-type protein 1-like [Aphis craccivora]
MAQINGRKHLSRLSTIIGATLPVSIATSERSFSYLRRLKTYLRNKTGEERLNGLMLLNLYRDVEVTCEEVIDIMAKKQRRIDLCFII